MNNSSKRSEDQHGKTRQTEEEQTGSQRRELIVQKIQKLRLLWCPCTAFGTSCACIFVYDADNRITPNSRTALLSDALSRKNVPYDPIKNE